MAVLVGACTDVHDSARTAAENVVGFLNGDAGFESIRLADTVEFFLPDEAGGARRRVARHHLSDRNAWTIRSGRNSYSFVPPEQFTQMTVKVGRHFNCMETALGSRVPALAKSMHVGVRLQPDEAQSCLQSWNATFVYDTTGGIVRLTGAVYDSWEW